MLENVRKHNLKKCHIYLISISFNQNVPSSSFLTRHYVLRTFEYHKLIRRSDNHDADPQRHSDGGQHPGSGQVMTSPSWLSLTEKYLQIPPPQLQGARGRGRECCQFPRYPERQRGVAVDDGQERKGQRRKEGKEIYF